MRDGNFELRLQVEGAGESLVNVLHWLSVTALCRMNGSTSTQNFCRPAGDTLVCEIPCGEALPKDFVPLSLNLTDSVNAESILAMKSFTGPTNNPLPKFLQSQGNRTGSTC